MLNFPSDNFLGRSPNEILTVLLDEGNMIALREKLKSIREYKKEFNIA